MLRTALIFETEEECELPHPLHRQNGSRMLVAWAFAGADANAVPAITKRTAVKASVRAIFDVLINDFIYF